MAKKLTPRQKELLKILGKLMRDTDSEAPTYRELAEKLEVDSIATISLHLKALARKGFIQMIPGAHRSIKILRTSEKKDLIEKPVYGPSAAGKPIWAKENIEGYEKFSVNAVNAIPDFLLKVKGDSMIEADINDGNLVAVKKGTYIDNGDIGVFRINDDTTIKRFYKEKGFIILKPANKNYPNIIIKDSGDSFVVVGKVVGVLKNNKKGGDLKE